MTDKVARRWWGGGYLPGRSGLWGFSGLVVAELAGTKFTVRVRPRFLGNLLGVNPLTAEPGSGVTVTTTRVRLGWGWFINFRLPGGQEYSFVTGDDKDEMLSCLTAVGFEVLS